MHIEYVKIGEDGRVVIPSSLRKELGIRPGDTLVIESDGDSLLVRGYERMLAEVQAGFADVDTQGGTRLGGAAPRPPRRGGPGVG